MFLAFVLILKSGPLANRKAITSQGNSGNYFATVARFDSKLNAIFKEPSTNS